MIDGPTAAIIISAIAAIVVAVVKFVPSRSVDLSMSAVDKHISRQAADVARLDQQLKDIERRIEKNEIAIETQREIVTKWLRDQQ